MEYEVIAHSGQSFVRPLPGGVWIAAENDAIALVQFCAEADTDRILLPAACLSPDFFRLSTRLAGLVLQKLANYRVKAAVVLDTAAVQGKFYEFMLETNRGQTFRVFDDESRAAAWLLGETAEA